MICDNIGMDKWTQYQTLRFFENQQEQYEAWQRQQSEISPHFLGFGEAVGRFLGRVFCR